MTQLPERRRGNHDDDDDDDDGGVGYFNLDQLARYSGLSVASLRRYLHRPVNPLPHLVVGKPGTKRGRVLVPRREFDAWLRASFSGTHAAPAAPAAPARGTRRDPADPSWILRAFDK